MQERRAFRSYRIVIILLFVLVFLIAALVSDPKHIGWSNLLLFTLIGILCELAPVELGRDFGTITLTHSLITMTMVLYGPLAVVILSLTAFLVANIISWTSAFLTHRFPTPPTQNEGALFLLRVLVFRRILPWIGRPWMGRHAAPFGWNAMNLCFNAADTGLKAAISSFVYILAGGKLIGISETIQMSSMDWVRSSIAGVVALIVFFALDNIVFVMGSVLYESVSNTWSSFLLRCNIKIRQIFSSVMRGEILLTILAATLIYLYVQIGTVAILVLFIPLYMARDTLMQTLMQVQTYRDTIATLGSYMQRYHPYTRGHLKRVADMSERLARELRLSPESIMLMPDAGMLHDIGKVAVSEEILDKIGRLTDEEWAIIKQHPVKGAEIISHLPYLDRIVDWVKYHHKWVDGSGYPDDGTKDGQIPVEAAIIAVADAFDAMTDDRDLSIDWVCDSCGYQPSDGLRPEICPECGSQKRRVYREPLSVDDAVDQLRRGAGTQFSPPVVKAFLRMLQRDGVHLNA